MPTEKIKYDPITGCGSYKISAPNLEINLSFTIETKDYRSRKDKVFTAMNAARKKAYAMLYGVETANSFSDYIDYVATWFIPWDAMTGSQADAWAKASEFYKPCNVARCRTVLPEFAQDLNALCNKILEKTDD